MKLSAIPASRRLPGTHPPLRPSWPEKHGSSSRAGSPTTAARSTHTRSTSTGRRGRASGTWTQRVHRLLRRTRRPAARPPPARDRPCHRRGPRPRNPLRLEPRGRVRWAQGGQGAGAGRGAGPVHVVRNRSHPSCPPHRARRDRTAQGGALPDPFPRLARPHGAGIHLALDGTATPGVLDEVAGSVVLLDPGDETAMRETLAGDPDVAGPSSWSRPERRSGSSPSGPPSSKRCARRPRRTGRSSSSTRW